MADFNGTQPALTMSGPDLSLAHRQILKNVAYERFSKTIVVKEEVGVLVSKGEIVPLSEVLNLLEESMDLDYVCREDKRLSGTTAALAFAYVRSVVLMGEPSEDS
jgi:hypothetical protein